MESVGSWLEVPFKNTGDGVVTSACEEVSPKLMDLTMWLRVMLGDLPWRDGERDDWGLEGVEEDLVRDTFGLEGRDLVKVCCGLEGVLSLIWSIHYYFNYFFGWILNQKPDLNWPIMS